MKILKDLMELKIIVSKHAKFQKTMLIFDDNTSYLETEKIHNLIKSECIYNQQHIKDLDKSELLNGYKLIIVMLSADNLLKLDVNFGEFVCVFCNIDNNFLPFVLANKKGNNNFSNYYAFLPNKFDFSIFSSISFCRFYNFLKNFFVCCENNCANFPTNWSSTSHLSISNLINQIKDLPADFEFVDIKLISNCNIEYINLPLVDMLIVNAFMVLLNGAKTHSVGFVDIFKLHKEDYPAIDKFYALANDQYFLQVLELNYDLLYRSCVEAKSNIILSINSNQLDEGLICELNQKIKNYCSKTDDLLAYLYLYNVFGN